jgi:hypothetical protein
VRIKDMMHDIELAIITFCFRLRCAECRGRNDEQEYYENVSQGVHHSKRSELQKFFQPFFKPHFIEDGKNFYGHVA